MKKQVSIRTFILSIALILTIAGGFVWYVSATLPSNTFTISSGMYPGASSYTVWNESGTVYAKDSYGLIRYSGSVASTVVNDALVAMQSSGLYKLLLIGPLTVNAPIVCVSDIEIEIEGNITLANAANCVMFSATDVHGVSIHGGILDGNKASNTQGIGIYVTTGTYTVDLLDHFYDMKIQNFAQNGIKILGNSREVVLDKISVYDSDEIGFYIGGGDHKISNCVAGHNYGCGFYFADVGGCQVENCKAFGTYYNTTISFGDGFLISGVRNLFTNCYAQENARHGFLIYTTMTTLYGRFNTFVNCEGESNNFGNLYAGVGFRIDNCNNNTIIGGTYTNMIGTYQKYGVWLANYSAGNLIQGANVIGNAVSGIVLDANATGLNNKIRNCLGCVNQNGGEASVSSGGTIPHGLVTTPTFVELTPKGSSPENIAGWSYNTGTTTITVYYNATSSPITFSWYAEYNP